MRINYIHFRKNNKDVGQKIPLHQRVLKHTKTYLKMLLVGFIAFLLFYQGVYDPFDIEKLLRETAPPGDFSVEEDAPAAPEVEIPPAPKEDFVATLETIGQITTFEDLQKYVYTIDPTAYATMEDFPLQELTQMNLRSNLKGDAPKVLIFHTHSQETFVDSQPGVEADTIVGVGETLARILVETYDISVVHDVGKYDYKDGVEVRTGSYENMEPAVTNLLKKYPSIEVVIDLHRDSIDSGKLVTEIEGRPTAKVMFFNGITRINDNGRPKAVENLENPYLKENLALSLQLYLNSNALYPGFARRNYIKPYRYSLHMKPKSMLVEVGADSNTVEEAKNAMEPLAKVIVTTLEK